MRRRRPVGAEVVDGGVHFRVWAPSRSSVSVVIEGDRDAPLARSEDGYFAGLLPSAGAGTRYRFRVAGEATPYPDPASRFQPEGPHGPSMVIDPSGYRWLHDGWRGIDPQRLVIYELHVGTFTPEGTFRAAIEKLPLLRDVGITLLELMPIADFPGRFGWGYDGVDLWAPTRLYGQPDDFRAFVDAAHALDLGVILDVVYNHFGPDGCYLSRFSESYFTKKYVNEWGEAINYDGDGCQGTREFVSENAAYWIDEFHLDGLRLDATQSIIDQGHEHVIALITRRAREAAPHRRIYLVGENEPQDVQLLTRDGLDALWNDDWHHAAVVALGGRREAYYTDYRGTPQELLSMARHNFLYQGQWYSWQKNRRGTRSSSLPPHRFVCYLEDHDQVANSAHGHRLHRLASPGNFRAMTALLLLTPQTPMLFQGEEFGSSAPFLYFADHKPELAQAVAEGRQEFLEQFPSIDTAEVDAPHAPETFAKCKLDWAERTANSAAVDLHRDLLSLRRELAVERVDGALLSDSAFLIRGGDAFLLLVNLGPGLIIDTFDEPLFAGTWTLRWSSESPRYGGGGMAPLEVEHAWHLPAHAALVLTPSAAASPDR